MDTPEHWEGEARAPLLLEDAAVSLGPPSEHADLRPDVAQGATRHYRHLRRLNPPGTRWLTCFYGSDRTFVLSAMLPEGIDSCTITRTRDRDNVVQVLVSCRP